MRAGEDINGPLPRIAGNQRRRDRYPTASIRRNSINLVSRGRTFTQGQSIPSTQSTTLEMMAESNFSEPHEPQLETDLVPSEPHRS